MYHNIRKAAKVLALSLIFTLVFTAYASAHIVVKPGTAHVSAWELYTMRVPNEKEIATNKITLRISTELNYKQYEPVAGWTLSVEKDASGKATALTWTATGTGILPGQFQEFKFVAQNPKKPEVVFWDAYQYYQDGSTVAWEEKEGAEHPHSSTQIVSAETTHEMPEMEGMKMPSTPEPAKAPAKEAPSSDPWLATVLSLIAIIVSVLTAFFVLLRKR